MSDIKKIFHEIALESSLFKGRHDWYFCFLKSEKIAHVLVLLSEKIAAPDAQEWFLSVVSEAGKLPSSIAHFASGDVELQTVLADIFSLLSAIRLSSTRGYISKENAFYIAGEYERVAEKLSAGNQLSPFVSASHFAVPEFLERQNIPTELRLTESLTQGPSQKVIGKNVQKGQNQELAHKGHESQSGVNRSAVILDYVLKNKGVSIKDISAVVPDCSEKTVQRELIALIGQGRIKREGERRWSIYKPA